MIVLASCRAHKKNTHSKRRHEEGDEEGDDEAKEDSGLDPRDLTSEAGVMEGKIRNKGTFILSYVDVSNESEEGDAKDESSEKKHHKKRMHKKSKEEAEDEAEDSSNESSDSEDKSGEASSKSSTETYYTAPSKAKEIPEGESARTHALFDGEKIELPSICK